MRILYLHGIGDRLGGRLPRFLESLGWTVVEPELPNDNFDNCVQVAQRAFDECQPDLVLGYSMGGSTAISLSRTSVQETTKEHNLASGNTPQVLIAPSWKLRCPEKLVKPHTIIINAEDDFLVPPEDAKELLALSGLSEAKHLVIAGSGHGIFDEPILEVIRQQIERAVSMPQGED
jgi:hypothetical protein